MRPVWLHEAAVLHLTLCVNLGNLLGREQRLQAFLRCCVHRQARLLSSCVAARACWKAGLWTCAFAALGSWCRPERDRPGRCFSRLGHAGRRRSPRRRSQPHRSQVAASQVAGRSSQGRRRKASTQDVVAGCRASSQVAGQTRVTRLALVTINQPPTVAH